jgi:hypothetical protein
MWKGIFTVLCALLVDVVLLHSVNNSAFAHDTKTDSTEPVELGSVFNFPAKEFGVHRPACTKIEYVELALSEIAQIRSTEKVHHLLFHFAKKERTKRGTRELKHKFKPSTLRILEDRSKCAGINYAKFAPVEVIKEIDIHGYKVSVIAIYESYVDEEGIFYTWFVNTNFVDSDQTAGTHLVRGNDNKMVIGEKTNVKKGLYVVSGSADLIYYLINSTQDQPYSVGRKVLVDPAHGFASFSAREKIATAISDGSLKVTNREVSMTFRKLLETKAVHGLKVSIFTFGPDFRQHYTWLINAEVIEGGKQTLTK